MSREIKFRGKRIDNGEWAYGYYAVHKLMMTGEVDYFIIVNEQRPQSTEPETIGQYTGLKDKNGKEIYEGDIVNRIFPSSGTIEMRVVIYHKDGYRLQETGKFKGLSLLCSAIEDIEIIGNIYENNELLEVVPID
jgi:uncharacterized phage protein (TIGR01671 family)